MFKSEKNKLKSLIDEEVWDLLKANKAIIAGGAITSLFTNKDVNDLDIYLPSQRAVVNILADSFGLEKYTETYDYVAQFQLMFIDMAEKSIMFNNDGQDIQLITFQYFDSAEDIFDTFDFTCCMGAFDLDKDEFILHPKFMQHNAQKYLEFNSNTAFPLVSALRVNKYLDKGYTISKSEYLRVIMQCMSLNINSWEEVKSHIGGMYGQNMDEFFDEEQEFSLEEAMRQMSIKEIIHPYVAQEKDFVKILNRFDPSEEIAIPEPPYLEGYFYKHVGKDMKSSMYHTKKIDYSVGNIVNGGNNGIYVHCDPKDPYTKSGICVELEAVGDFEIKDEKGYWYGHSGQSRLIGDFKVTRVMPHWEPSLSKAEIKYMVKE